MPGTSPAPEEVRPKRKLGGSSALVGVWREEFGRWEFGRSSTAEGTITEKFGRGMTA
ncbi:hypothetical protein COCNU_scaffold024667G000020 [Cocos nucifera]|nr:hypothetical protein [Cocos nucifera]